MACNCKNCKDVTLFKGSDGVGVQHIEFNGCPTACDGTFTIFLTDGTTYTSPNLVGDRFKYVAQFEGQEDATYTITRAELISCRLLPDPSCVNASAPTDNFTDFNIQIWTIPNPAVPPATWTKLNDATITVDAATGDISIVPGTTTDNVFIRVIILS
jgi:hypothetical protein